MSSQNVNKNVNENVSQNVNRNVNKNVNINVNKNVNRNVSREPNFRYTTILLKKMKENDKKMSAGNPILGTQRYLGRK